VITAHGRPGIDQWRQQLRCAAARYVARRTGRRPRRKADASGRSPNRAVCPHPDRCGRRRRERHRHARHRRLGSPTTPGHRARPPTLRSASVSRRHLVPARHLRERSSSGQRVPGVSAKHAGAHRARRAPIRPWRCRPRALSLVAAALSLSAAPAGPVPVMPPPRRPRRPPHGESDDDSTPPCRRPRCWRRSRADPGLRVTRWRTSVLLPAQWLDSPSCCRCRHRR